MNRTDQDKRADHAADRIFQSGILDEIYEHAYQHGRTGRVLPGNERDAMEDAYTLARIVLGEVDP